MERPVTNLASLATGLVAPGVHAIYSRYGSNKPLIVYVLEGEFTLWVDTGIHLTPEEHVLPYLRERTPALWKKPQVVVVTHADVDHFGGIAQLRRARPDVFIMAHAADQRWIESEAAIVAERYAMHEREGVTLPAERREILRARGGGGASVQLALQGHEVIDLGAGNRWSLLPAPGHTPGHLVLWNEQRRDLIIGDAALDWGVPDAAGGLLAPPPYYDLPAYERTVAMLRDLKAERVFTSHQGVLNSAQAGKLFANSLSAIQMIGQAVEAALRAADSGLTLDALAADVGRRANVWEESLWPGLVDPISAHVAVACGDGRVERMSDSRRYRWRH